MLKCAKKPILPIKILACTIIVLAFGINACKPVPEELQFQTIEQEQFTDSTKMYESPELTLIVFSGPEDINDLKTFVNDEGKEKIRTLDYSKNFAILVLQGYKPGLCYGVNITEITRLQENVLVYADFTEAKPNIECAATVSSPYHLVQIEKTGSWGQDIKFDLIANQLQIHSVTHFIS